MGRIDVKKALELRDEGWSPSHIAEFFGVTRQAVWKSFRKRGIETGKGTSAFWFDVECAVCNKPLKRLRSRVRNQVYHYCSRDCYFAMLDAGSTADASYHGGMNGMRARRYAEKYFGGPLPEGAIVHHEDRDRVYNGPDNLIIFKDQGDHMRWHRKIKVEPLWPNPIPKHHFAYSRLREFKQKKDIWRNRK